MQKRVFINRLAPVGGWGSLWSLIFGVWCFPAPLFAQAVLGDPEERVIRYEASEDLADPVALLQKKLAVGPAKLSFEPGRGYLTSLLAALSVPVSSQGLVFSKTSSQRDHTSPQTPRAVYFGDDISVAWVPGGPVIDLASVDPKRGPIFYTLEQSPDAPPKFTRRNDCMTCHLGPKTLNVPGLLVRSVYTASNGMPVANVPGFVNGHNSPLRERWAGWYVTGAISNSPVPAGGEELQAEGSPSLRPSAGRSVNSEGHLGNIFVSDPAHPERLDLGDRAAPAGATGLRERFDTSPYLSAHSDMVALLVLEHEVRMHNLITRANYETRLALDQQAGNDAHNASADWPRQRIALAGEMLLEYMLFRNEAPLNGPVKGTSTFAADFERDGPRASQGRSLRQLDLQTRLFRYPCSFLIYSSAFDALPQEMKTYLWRRLDRILTGQDRSPAYATLSACDRQAVLEILRETKPEFAAWLRK